MPQSIRTQFVLSALNPSNIQHTAETTSTTTTSTTAAVAGGTMSNSGDNGPVGSIFSPPLSQQPHTGPTPPTVVQNRLQPPTSATSDAMDITPPLPPLGNTTIPTPTQPMVPLTRQVPLIKALESFKFLAECPSLIPFFLQIYPKITQKFLPSIIQHLMLCLELVPPVYTAPIGITTTTTSTGAAFTSAGGAGVGGIADGATGGGGAGQTSTTTSTSVHTNVSGVDALGGPVSAPATTSTSTLTLPGTVGAVVGGADDVAVGMARYRERSNDWISAQVTLHILHYSIHTTLQQCIYSTHIYMHICR